MTQGGEEEAKLQLKLEYMSGPVAEEGSGPPVGRHLLLPVQLRILPSVQVRSIGKTSEIKIPYFFRLASILATLNNGHHSFASSNVAVIATA